jgi:NAD(P)-dependent dehydrogenase (short-subunit alcohol dehydrogenase family)
MAGMQNEGGAARLAGKIALITGAAGAIGSAAARRFIQEGARVFLVDRDASTLHEIAASIGHQAAAMAADVSNHAECQAYVAAAVAQFGGIDIFLNNAGVEGAAGPRVHESPIDAFDRVMAVNVRGSWLGIRYVVPEMIKRGGGSVVISSSVAGVIGYPGGSAYIMSKHALLGLARGAALEYGRDNVRINAVCPAPFESRMMRSIEEGLAPGAAAAAKQLVLETIPLGRYAQVDDVVNLMLFLASDDSLSCTGACYMVDGGISAA